MIIRWVVDGSECIWEDGVFTGDEKLIEPIRMMVDSDIVMPFHHPGLPWRNRPWAVMECVRFLHPDAPITSEPELIWDEFHPAERMIT
jgi:hypothetical protein